MFPRLAVTIAMIMIVGLLTVSSLSRSADTDTVQFTPQYLSDPANIALGREVWFKRCKFCHGREAYPGKAPRLQPARYTPQFVYDRVTNGFRGMPSWKQEFSQEQRKAVAAYVMSKDFPN
jgi:mono/diheme cytochrome c family protein